MTELEPLEAAVLEELRRSGLGLTVEQLADILNEDTLAITDACIGLQQKNQARLQWRRERGHVMCPLEEGGR